MADLELQKLSRMFDESFVGVLLFDPSGKLIKINKALIDMLGITDSSPLMNISLFENPMLLEETRKKLLKGERIRKKTEIDFVKIKELNIFGTNKTGRIFIEYYLVPLFADYEKTLLGYLLQVHDITEYKLTEDELRKNEERLIWEHKMFFKGPVVVFRWVAAENWPVEYVSPNVIQFGYRPEEFLSGKVLYSKIVHPDDMDRVASEVKDNSEKGVMSFDQFYRILDRKRGVRHIYDHTCVIRDQDDKIIYYDGYVFDITEQKQKDTSLQESEERYKKLVQITPEAIVVHSEGKIVYINAAGAKTIGADSPEEVIGKPVLDFVHPDYRQAVIQRTKVMYESGEKVPAMEEKFLRLDGKIIDVEVAAAGLQYQGKPSVIVAIRDITEQKQKETSLRESEERYKSLVQLLPDAVVVHSGGKVVFINQKGAESVGAKSPEEIIGRSIKDYIHPDSIQLALQRTKIMYEQQKPLPSVEEKFIRIDGRVIDTEVTGMGLVFQGKPSAIVVIRDITERKKSEEKLKELYKDLVRTNKKLERLALRDPHTGLYNFRYLEDIIEVEFHKCRRNVHPLSVVMMDIDYFKSLNDVYGHQFGDLVLKQFGKYLQSFMRKSDVLIRYGGEEFVIVSPGVNRSGAMKMSQRLLDSLNFTNFGNKSHKVKLKISMAVVSCPEDACAKGMDLVSKADHVLNKVKEFGGNTVYSTDDTRDKKKLAENDEDVKVLKDKIDKLNKRANQSLIEAIFAFAKTLELKDYQTGVHTEKTVKYATEIAVRMKLPRQDVESVKQAAILHDLGKIGISEKILLKKAKLTKEEFEEIKKHPQIAADILRPIQHLHALIPHIIYHHERWDGKGYPNKLKGQEIPVGARIVAVADVYQALTSARPYRKAYSKKEALKMIKQEAGKQFDPKIIELFLKIAKKK
ncbi:MAG: PAS domain S-box protein [Elusimicrobiota bacterium]